MAKKKKRSKDGTDGKASGSKESVTDSSSEMDSVEAPSAEPKGAESVNPAPAEASREASKAPAPGGPVDFDAAARDRFASSFKPAWQVAEEAAASAKPAQEALRQEHALSGEISLDSIPLPPLPTEKPKRQMIGVAIVVVLIIIAGVVASTRSQPSEAPAPASAGQASER
ncbi:MAG: hypothetical protein IPG17_15425 [Sandaracinaceae bacterium]|nr:hypothetical protein [Sandaracinaceae bacterium]MBK6810115.1 hypothetical protein [Sandaracinaceae bacterium]MBK7153983.1 hypothetical protein [Sandaracinaceae bacterium]